MIVGLWDPDRRLQDLETALRLLLAQLPTSDPRVMDAISETASALRADGLFDAARLMSGNGKTEPARRPVTDPRTGDRPSPDRAIDLDATPSHGVPPDVGFEADHRPGIDLLNGRSGGQRPLGPRLLARPIGEIDREP